MKKKAGTKVVPITRPTLEPFASYAPLLKETVESGMLTMNRHGRALEEKIAAYLGVKHAVLVSSCTSGLMLALKGLGVKGEVIIPSFTFSASPLAIVWNNATPVFVDCTIDMYGVDVRAVEKAITKKTTAILATHVFGIPVAVKELERLAKKHNLKLIFDAAHAFGSTIDGKPVGGFGDVEVFSCSPTKVLTTGEGGIVATNNDALADFCRKGRNYGDDGTNDLLFAGLSARMSEFNAAIGLRSFAKLKENLKKRRACAAYLTKQFIKIEPRIRFQAVPKNVESTFKDLSLHVDETVLGFTRDELHDYFASRGVMTRKYFFPPLHMQRAYKRYAPKGLQLPVTMQVATRALSLPLYAHLSKGDMNYCISVFKDFIHDRKKA